MQFNVPVRFNLTATRIGGERRQSTQAWSIVKFEIPDLSDDDAPVVLIWTQSFHGFEFHAASVKHAIGPSPSDKPMHVRKVGEAFYRPILRNRDINAVRVSHHGENADFLTGQSVVDMLMRFDDGGVFATTMPSETFQRRLGKNGGNGLVDFENVDRHDLDGKVAVINEKLSK